MTVREKRQILFVYGSPIPFVKRDYEILAKHYSVHKVECGLKLAKLNPANYWKIFVGALKTEISFTWFAGIPAAFTVGVSRLLGKQAVVVVGGAEVVNVPEIKYGFLRNPFLKIFTKFVLAYSDYLLPVSEFLEEKILHLLPDKQRGKVIRIHNGVDEKIFFADGSKEKVVMTTAFLSSKNIVRKGLKTFIECARQLPDVHFVIFPKSF